MTEIARMDELKQELEELRALVNTLLTIIMEEAMGSNRAQPSRLLRFQALLSIGTSAPIVQEKCSTPNLHANASLIH